jgi:hypothetical protein
LLYLAGKKMTGKKNIPFVSSFPQSVSGNPLFKNGCPTNNFGHDEQKDPSVAPQKAACPTPNKYG